MGKPNTVNCGVFAGSAPGVAAPLSCEERRPTAVPATGAWGCWPDLKAAPDSRPGPLEDKGAAIEHKEELRLKDRNYRVFFGFPIFSIL